MNSVTLASMSAVGSTCRLIVEIRSDCHPRGCLTEDATALTLDEKAKAGGERLWDNRGILGPETDWRSPDDLGIDREEQDG